jgi:hypothetical protein
MWSTENLHTFHEKPLHSLKVRVWCAVSQWRVTGPIFFSETITAERYQKLLINLISLLEVDEQDCLFQQDGAMAHAANSTMQMLSKFFGGHIIFLNLWPSRSPDLSPPVFHLWGFSKENVYKINPHTREELKQNCELRISNVTAETLHRVASNMRKRVNACIAECDGHFQHLI